MVYYYKKKIPSIDDIVVARVDKISEYGVEVSLSEYNGIKGFINCGEVSRKKRINLSTLLTIGKEILLNVIQVDTEKQLIDLSKRTISEDDIKLFNSKHKTHIQLYNIFKYIYIQLYNKSNPTELDDEKLYDFMCVSLWEIQTECENDVLIEKILSKDLCGEILDLIDFDSLDKTREDFMHILINYIENKINRIKPELIETIKLMTYSLNGLSDIKYALDFENFLFYPNVLKDFSIKILYMSSSTYSINIIQNEFDIQGDIDINDLMGMIKKEIKNRAESKQIQNQIVI